MIQLGISILLYGSYVVQEFNAFDLLSEGDLVESLTAATHHHMHTYLINVYM